MLIPACSKTKTSFHTPIFLAAERLLCTGGESFANSDEDADDSDGEDVDKKRLRYYERSRLRYYYAVAEMDSTQTANRIYVECDGLEFEHSACRLDLRFVPDSLDLTERQVKRPALQPSLQCGCGGREKRNNGMQTTVPRPIAADVSYPSVLDTQVRDTAESVPPDYEAPVFQTKALMHSNVQLTWDTDDSSRKKVCYAH